MSELMEAVELLTDYSGHYSNVLDRSQVLDLIRQHEAKQQKVLRDTPPVPLTEEEAVIIVEEVLATPFEEPAVAVVRALSKQCDITRKYERQL